MERHATVARIGASTAIAIALAFVALAVAVMGTAHAQDSRPSNKVVRAGEMLWEDWSWDSELSRERYRVNSYRVLGVAFNDAWAGLYLHHDGFDTTPYESVRFHLRDINSTLASGPHAPRLPDLKLWLVDAEGVFIEAVRIEPYVVRFADSYFGSIPLTVLDGRNRTITGVVLQDITAPRGRPVVGGQHLLQLRAPRNSSTSAL